MVHNSVKSAKTKTT